MTKNTNFQKKKQTLLQQLASTPDNVSAMIELAKLYADHDLLSEAKQLFQRILEYIKDDPNAYNNYGSILYRLGEMSAAEEVFLKALKLQKDHFSAMYNLALALKAQNKIDEAVSALMAIINADPKNLNAHFLLGKLLLEKSMPDDANEHFKMILFSENIDLLKKSILCLLSADYYKEAKPYCEKLLQLTADDEELLYNLGVIENRLNHKQEAINYYLKALEINLHHFSALNNIAVLYLETGSIATAKHYFEQALKIQPANKSIQYSLSVLSGGQQFKEAPSNYLKNLFDSYADHFEQHLCEALDYQVPETLKKLIKTFAKDQPLRWRIVDLGCGTGLCGPLFKLWAKELIGVDLSPKMLAEAKKKDCYDELIESEDVEYLLKQKENVDLIIAADVFVYQGDLHPVLKACHHALSQKGVLAFSTEIYEGEEFTSQKTGRFAHSKAYIEELAKELGFTIKVFEIGNTRSQRGQQLKGYFFVLGK